MATRIRERAIAHKENADKRPSATVKYAGVSAKKAGLICDMVRGKGLGQAVGLLENSNNAAAAVIKKLVLSAAANAENNNGMDVAQLYVAEIYANQGPTLKRIEARAQGRASRIRRRTSHITVVLDVRA